MLTAVTGINWGDEGKGRVIDLLAGEADVVVRYQGGNNAGHTVVADQGKFILNLIPSGILHDGVICVLGDGMVVDLEHLEDEIAKLRQKGVSVSPKNLKISQRATISMPWHRIQDELEEDRLAKSGSAFGSTRRGIAYAYSDKYRKKTLRMGDLLRLNEEGMQARLKMMLDAKNMELAGCYHQEPMSFPALLQWCNEQAEKFADYICDTGAFLEEALQKGKKVILEAQLGAMRDIDYGIFPYTSSSSTIAAYAPIGAGNPDAHNRSCCRGAKGIFHLRGCRPVCGRESNDTVLAGDASQAGRRVWSGNRKTEKSRSNRYTGKSLWIEMPECR